MFKKSICVTLLSVFLISACFGQTRPKNIIIMIADGCGYNQLDAASLYHYGKTSVWPFESFPVKIAMSTFDHQGHYDCDRAWKDFNYLKVNPTDSAAAATAMSTGVKTYSGAVGVNIDKEPLANIVEKCNHLSMATGVVTSVQLSHATPACFVVHDTNRNNLSDIANKMIYHSKCTVIMGCGAPDFNNDGKPASKSKKYVGGSKTWTDITDDGKVIGTDIDGDGVKDVWTVVRTRQQFLELVQGDTPERVLGIAQVHQTLQQARSGPDKAAPYEVAFTTSVPTLKEMTNAALNILDNDPDGFFMMVEGGAVDWAGHANQSGRMIEEQISFNETVQAVIDWIEKNSSWEESLLIVTSDHETGYLSLESKTGEAKTQPDMKWHSGGHTNQLVPFFAKGCNSEMFKQSFAGLDPCRGPYIDNTDIAKRVFLMLDKAHK